MGFGGMRGRTRTGEGLRGDPRFGEFVARFNAGRFFAAHEVLEELWLEIEGEEREFLQGLIQIAVALEHRARGNGAGALKVLGSARRRLRGYGARHAGLALQEILDGAGAFLAGERSDPPRLPRRAEVRAAKLRRAEVRAAKPRRAEVRAAKGTTPAMTTKKKAPAAAPRASGSSKTKSALGAKLARRARTVRAVKAAVRPKPIRGGKAGPRPLEPLETRRARALAILRGLRLLHPDARCELRHDSALELLVATILSAQCTDVRVNLTTPALFARYRDARSYGQADLETLGEIIRSTGFYRNKAKSIVALGKALEERHGGEVPATMDELVRLPGVGRKTANVILAEWFGQPGIAVDTHVIRLTGPVWRLTNETDPVKIEFALYELIPEEDRAFFGIATIFHGRRICTARRPDCAGCALNTICPSAFARIAG